MSNIHQACSLKTLLDHPDFYEGEYWQRSFYNPEQLVIVEGEIGNEIFAIISGKVSVCTNVIISENRRFLSGLCELFDGEEFAHSCFFDDEPHGATVKTITNCELAAVDAGKLRHFLNDHPEIGYSLLLHWVKIMLPRIRQGNKRFSSMFSWGLRAHRIDASI
ncbi:MAG: cyclic nucleotide-binding domain-containing protein [Gammaproteobacteria bacterium]